MGSDEKDARRHADLRLSTKLQINIYCVATIYCVKYDAMGATLVFAKKEIYGSGLIVEAVIWQLPGPTADRPHGLKYREKTHGKSYHRYSEFQRHRK